MSKNAEIISNWSETDKIRNVSIISHVDHGKTTLSDHLVAAGGILPKHLAGQLRALDDLPEEQRRGITIEMSYTSIIINYEKSDYLINLIDTPGHVDFSGKVAESLRLVDGAFILVDAVEGIMAQTKTVLKQAIKEKVRLILFINKLDRLITELELKSMKIQARIERIIGEIQALFVKSGMDKKHFPNFSEGTIIMGSALDGWAIDFEYVKTGGRITDIVDKYNQGNIDDLVTNSPIISAFARAMISKMPSPKLGQNMKFPGLFVEPPPPKTLETIFRCDPEDDPILLVGRSHRIQNTGQVSYIVRLLSGKIIRGITLKESHQDTKLRVTKVFQIVGKNLRDVKELRAGQIGGIIVSKPVIPGDALTTTGLNVPKISDISYVQDAVVAVSIEPLELKDIGKLESSISNICEVTPGLEYEINKDTGELIAMGVGTLQLEILKAELIEQKLDLEVSDPIIIKFEMPTRSIKFINEKWEAVRAQAGRTNEINELISPLYSDTQSNRLFTLLPLQKDTEDGIIEVFKQYMRVSPIYGKRVRNFTLVITNFPDSKKLQTYENGIIIGSSTIKQALTLCQTEIHEPYYHIEISTPEEYLGGVLQELYKFDLIIDDVISNETESNILGQLQVQHAPKLADRLRQITDGNVFWSFSAVSFLPNLIK